MTQGVKAGRFALGSDKRIDLSDPKNARYLAGDRADRVKAGGRPRRDGGEPTPAAAELPAGLNAADIKVLAKAAKSLRDRKTRASIRKDEEATAAIRQRRLLEMSYLVPLSAASRFVGELVSGLRIRLLFMPQTAAGRIADAVRRDPINGERAVREELETIVADVQRQIRQQVKDGIKALAKRHRPRPKATRS